ncbi:MAG: formyltransferase [endosymbiont of Escarpia spicata]|uniref:Formyltransferase n=1 Tax=endosymbiont of Escarpia spicata TaxID=2200908 RepID=A0A370DUJ9_9GAMM|nr:MAG: formyltransferase [endosymbiont of Escarpia spicata]
MESVTPRSAVVFAYHQVGVRCLSALLAQGVDVRLVVTHQDNPNENVWWESVAELAGRAGIPVITPEDPNTPEVVEQIRTCEPDLFFSFYYRHMLKADLLSIPRQGAYNMHGSLLPHYRGRVPVNWAIVHGETQSGASLHRMEIKPDAGDLVDQQAVTILPNDTALDLFSKLVCAAETVLSRSLPGLMKDSFKATPMDLRAGSYFGGRRPEDGRVDWSRSAWQIHNLIRAVAPPYPGAFTHADGKKLLLMGSYWRNETGKGDNTRLYWEAGRCYADCADGKRIELTRLELDGEVLDESAFTQQFGKELKL